MSRLEEIKIAYGYDTRLNKDTYPYWLINHIEELQSKVDELESLKSLELESASRIIEELQQENQSYKQALEDILTSEFGSEGLEAERELERITEIAIQALKGIER